MLLSQEVRADSSVICRAGNEGDGGEVGWSSTETLIPLAVILQSVENHKTLFSLDTQIRTFDIL